MSEARRIIVAVHGIGDQVEFSTIQAVVRQFCKCYHQPATVSIGRLDSDIRSAQGSLVLAPPLDPSLPINAAFTEVYWADIAREVETKGFRLEDARHWARTVIERLRLHQANGPAISEKDFELTKLVLQEMINAISVSEFFMTVFKHAGAYKPLLENALTNYLGDVQLVAEFREIRERILARFDEAMNAALEFDPGAEIHIIAHSEGTVVSFLGLLRALKDGGAAPSWVDRVRTFITLGSPIDKHLVLWPELWTEFEKPTPWRARPEAIPEPIRWANYYDLGDPVGFKLDTARTWLGDIACRAFDFPATSDYGFARSYFPGKAHVDYWTDQELFEHMIQTVIAPQPNKPKPAPPATDRLAAVSARVLPYVLAFLPLLAGVYMLYDALNTAMGYDETGKTLVVNSFLVALLLGGTTVWSRTTRLSRQRTPQLLAFGAYLLVTALFVYFMPPGAKENIGLPLKIFGVDNPNLATFLLSLVIAASGLVFPKTYSLKPMLGTGFFVVLCVLGAILMTDKAESSIGPVVATSVYFVCLWWLSAIVFDLSFVWHAYIRSNRAMDRLHQFYVARRKRG
ncbi:MAG: hypothetical protein PHU46_13070 [Rhodocyclaceae bacterium]|nr:hypothetical protein [Rhodocyclaceae bacterium]